MVRGSAMPVPPALCLHTKSAYKNDSYIVQLLTTHRCMLCLRCYVHACKELNSLLCYVTLFSHPPRLQASLPATPQVLAFEEQPSLHLLLSWPLQLDAMRLSTRSSPPTCTMPHRQPLNLPSPSGIKAMMRLLNCMALSHTVRRLGMHLGSEQHTKCIT